MSYSLAPDIPEEEKKEKRALKSALGMFLLGCGILRGLLKSFLISRGLYRNLNSS
jgi:hypothetical protein